MASNAGIETRGVTGAITSMRIDELISNMAIGIADGQFALDQSCMAIAEFMGEAQIAFGTHEDGSPKEISLVELGFTPNFYQFVDTILEVRVAVSSTYEETREYDRSQIQADSAERQSQRAHEASRSGAQVSSSRSGGWWSSGQRASVGWSGSASRSGSSSSAKAKSVSMTTVDAKYSSTYNYAVEASSLIKTKIVPVPPPEVFEEIVRANLQERRDREERARVLRATKTTIDALVTDVGAIITDTDETGLKATPFDEAAAAGVKELVDDLKQKYDNLTTDAWAAAQADTDKRTNAENALAEASEEAAKLEDAEVADLTTHLESFQTAITAIQAEVPDA